MAPATQPATVVRFGEFELDLRSGELRRGGQSTLIQPKVLEVLTTLLEHPGEVVTREELRAQLWSADTYVEFDDGLNHSIRKLRAALDDSAEHPRFIQTLPRHGYRFLAAVEPVAPPSPAEIGAAAVSRVVARYKLVAAAGLLVLLAAGGYLAWIYGLRARVHPRRVMLAILPLDNLTGDAEQDYLSDGLTEEIITELGRMNPDRLGVIARTSTLQYKKTRKTIAEIGRELGVDFVIEGSLRQASPQLRLTLQLIRVSDQTHLWAEAYDLPSRQVPSVEKDVASRLAQVLAIELSPAARRRLAGARPISPEAREAYLRGAYWLTRGSANAAGKARQYMEKATEIDPAFPQPYVGLAYAYMFLGNYGQIPQTEARPKTKAFAQKALELDDSLGDARLALAGIMLEDEWNFAEAEKEFRRATEESPNSALAHQWFSIFLSEIGRFEEAIPEMKKAYELDPLSLRVAVDVGRAHYWARHYDQAIDQYRKVLELDPNYSGAHSLLGLALLERRQYDEAIAELQKGVALLNTKTGYSLWLGYAYAVAGRKADAEKMLAIQFEERAQRHAAAPAIALTYLGMGDKDKALAWLETAYKERDGVTLLKAYPYWDPLRSDPRFQDLLRRVGLPQ